MKAIVIPTYWGRPQDEAAQAGDAIFDHPTPLDGQDTLTRCLESFAGLESRDFTLFVITATVAPELNQQVKERVEAIIAPFRSRFPVCQFSEADLQRVRASLEEKGLDREFFSLKNYPSIRNCQLLIPGLLEAEWIAAVDDDEIVPPDFLEKAGDFVGTVQAGTSVDGVAGFYYYEWGTFFVHEPEGARHTTNLFKRKAVTQNDSYRGFMDSPGRLVPTTITLGGNMVFSRRLYENVPFDPLVPRGEDIDYMINSRMLGYHWMMDKELRIDHFPPPCDSSLKLQEDVTRFIYEKRKLELSSQHEGLIPLKADDLKPYPGLFLEAAMETAAEEALAMQPEEKKSAAQYKTPQQVLREAHSRAEQADLYFGYAARWPEVLRQLREDEGLVAYFRKKLET